MTDIKGYIIFLYQIVPETVYQGILSLLILGLVMPLSLLGIKRGWRICFRIMLFLYIYLIFGITVLYRITNGNTGHNFNLFWSYKAILEGENNLIAEIIMNVLVFIPLGILLGLAWQSIKWWHVLIVGLSVSITIEALQYYLQKGFSEIDDIIHNVLGCMLGFGLFPLIKYGYKMFYKRRVGIL